MFLEEYKYIVYEKTLKNTLENIKILPKKKK